jgi:hypothetical protein
MNKMNLPERLPRNGSAPRSLAGRPEFVVRAWYARDHRPYADRFRPSLIEDDQPQDLIKIEKPKRERVTRLKPPIITAFMDRHAG